MADDDNRMNRMSMRLTPAMLADVDRAVDEGWFRSRSELIRDGARHAVLEPDRILEGYFPEADDETLIERVHVRAPDRLLGRLNWRHKQGYSPNVSSLVRAGIDDVLEQVDGYMN